MSLFQICQLWIKRLLRNLPSNASMGARWCNKYNEDYDYTLPSLVKPHPHTLSTSTLDSSQMLAFSSKLSHPSGLPVDAIAGLTHNELMLNAEFIQYVSLVSSLQNLINLWSTGQLAKFGEFPPAPIYLITNFHSLTLFLQLSLSVLRAPCVQASWHLKSLIPPHCFMCFPHENKWPHYLSTWSPLDLARVQEHPNCRHDCQQHVPPSHAVCHMPWKWWDGHWRGVEGNLAVCHPCCSHSLLPPHPHFPNQTNTKEDAFQVVFWDRVSCSSTRTQISGPSPIPLCQGVQGQPHPWWGTA